MPVTFHRAFDRCSDPVQALEDLIDCGCKRLLSSGQHPSVMNGLPLLAKLNTQANERIIIMPGSGLNSGNVREVFKRKQNAKKFILLQGNRLATENFSLKVCRKNYNMWVWIKKKLKPF